MVNGFKIRKRIQYKCLCYEEKLRLYYGYKGECVVVTRLSKIDVIYNSFPILNTNNITLAINECKIVQLLHKRKSQDKLIAYSSRVYTVFEIKFTIHKIG